MTSFLLFEISLGFAFLMTGCVCARCALLSTLENSTPNPRRNAGHESGLCVRKQKRNVENTWNPEELSNRSIAGWDASLWAPFVDDNHRATA